MEPFIHRCDIKSINTYNLDRSYYEAQISYHATAKVNYIVRT